MTIFSRKFAMPSPNTFDCKPIGDFVWRYLRCATISIDPFARNKRWATYTNDLNPKTEAEYHMDVLDFLKLMADRGVFADLIIFDPPFSPSQAKECYEGYGLPFMQGDAQRIGSWTKELDLCHKLLEIGGVLLYFGWNTMGMGSRGSYETTEIMIVSHGANHNDTLCMAQRKLELQRSLFDA